jgi:hypothetical protein
LHLVGRNLELYLRCTDIWISNLPNHFLSLFMHSNFYICSAFLSVVNQSNMWSVVIITLFIRFIKCNYCWHMWYMWVLICTGMSVEAITQLVSFFITPDYHIQSPRLHMMKHILDCWAPGYLGVSGTPWQCRRHSPHICRRADRAFFCQPDEKVTLLVVCISTVLLRVFEVPHKLEVPSFWYLHLLALNPLLDPLTLTLILPRSRTGTR